MGRSRLLKLQTTRQKEFEYLYNAVKADSWAVFDSEAAITKVEEEIKQAKTALYTYWGDLNSMHQNISKISIGSVIRANSTTEPRNLDSLLHVGTLIGSGPSNEPSHLKAQKKELEDRILHLETLLPRLERELHDWKVKLVLNQKSLNLHLAS